MGVTDCFVKRFETSDYVGHAFSLQAAPSR